MPFKFLFCVVRPESVGEKKLAVDRLPGKKPGESFLAAGADDDVRFRHTGGP